VQFCRSKIRRHAADNREQGKSFLFAVIGKYSVIASASGARVGFANWAVEDWNSQGIGEALFFSLKYLEKG